MECVVNSVNIASLVCLRINRRGHIEARWAKASAASGKLGKAATSDSTEQSGNLNVPSEDFFFLFVKRRTNKVLPALLLYTVFKCKEKKREQHFKQIEAIVAGTCSGCNSFLSK